MRAFTITVFALLAGSTCLLADPIPYPAVDKGIVAPIVPLYSQGGTVTLYFDGSNAAAADYIDVIDVTDMTSTGNIFRNNAPGATPVGATATLTGTSAGDLLVVEIYNSVTGLTFSSNPNVPGYAGADGTNHAYITPFTTADSTAMGGLIPVGTYIGLEDEAIPSSDLDYNDDTLVLADVSTTVPGSPTPPSSATPEPESILLLGTGILGAAGMVRRRSMAR